MPPVRTVPTTIASTSKVASWVIGEEKAATPKRGKSPPIEMFSREDQEITLDDWLPSLR